ncbi:MAG: prepilin-type N-terminal cleavage/methylation domain-containing protein [Deltaproteobacteria bacterium]|nr:prepilin-type N-terminal cleavage/methylation domain-containing protein [Deltaproteobacteria bacterium]
MKSRKLHVCQQGNHSEAPRTCLGCHRGFTLVELIVVIGIFSIVMAAIYSVFVRANRVYISQEEVVAAQQEARSALDILGREIRMAGLIAANNQPGGLDLITFVPVFETTGAPSWNGKADAAIGAATATTLALESDMDEDNKTEAVLYVYNATDGTLTREVLYWDSASGSGWNSTGGEQLFLENIQSLTLTYQMADGTSNTAPANLENIRGVVINLVAQTAYAVEPYEGGKRVRTRQLISNIQIRNLGLS